MSVWYTSDQHFHHRNIIDHCARPFATVDEMNDALVDNWNAVVAPDDTVWVLGDVAMNSKQLDQVQRLDGIKHLVAGNHDGCWSGHKRWRREVVKYIDAGFDQVYPESVIVRIPHADVLLSHLPYAGDSHADDRYADQRPVESVYELPMFCGHVHEKWKTRRTELGTLMINVGVDQWDYTPVAESVLVEMLKAEDA